MQLALDFCCRLRRGAIKLDTSVGDHNRERRVDAKLADVFPGGGCVEDAGIEHGKANVTAGYVLLQPQRRAIHDACLVPRESHEIEDKHAGRTSIAFLAGSS
jgi:hypothetical protein